MHKLIKKSEATPRKISDSHSALNYITKDFSPFVSLAVNTGTNHKENELTEYDRIYYVTNGQLEINIDNEDIFVNPGDSLFISKNTIYEFGGTFEAVVINQPAFGS